MSQFDRSHFYIRAWEQQLHKEYDRINWAYKLKLQRPLIRIVDVNTYWGQWDPLLREIKIARRLIQNHPWIIVIEILKHEIAHQMETDFLKKECDHGRDFQNFCEKMGVDHRFRRSKSQITLDEINFSSFKKNNDSSSSAFASDSLDAHSKGILQRAERLLSLAQSDNENEALAAMKKVMELYEKFNFSWLTQPAENKKFHLLQIDLHTQKASAIYSVLANILSGNFCVEVIFGQTYHPIENRFSKTLDILGTEENLIFAEYVFDFLTQQIETLWISYKKTNQVSHHHRRSFQLGILHGFREKLQSHKDSLIDPIASPTSQKQLVLLQQHDGFRHFFRSRYPRIHMKKTTQGRLNSESYSQGHREGKSLNLHRPIENSSSHKGREPGILSFFRQK